MKERHIGGGTMEIERLLLIPRKWVHLFMTLKKNLPFRIWNSNPSGDHLIIHVQQRDMNAHLRLIPPIITSVQTVPLLSPSALVTESTAVYGPY